MGKMNDVIMMARSAGASDIHISEGRPLQMRVNGKLMKAEMQPEPGSIRQVILEMLDGEKTGLDWGRTWILLSLRRTAIGSV